MREQPVDLAAERIEVGEIHEADRAAADFIFVSGADATSGGTDRRLAGRALARNVQIPMQREDERGVLGNAERVRRDLHTLFREGGDLVDQRLRIDDDAIADDGELAFPHHAGGQQRQFISRIADDQRVAGVVAALKAHDDVGLLGEPVDDLAFAFVAPLRADHDHVRHKTRSCGSRPLARTSKLWSPIKEACTRSKASRTRMRARRYPSTG